MRQYFHPRARSAASFWSGEPSRKERARWQNQCIASSSTSSGCLIASSINLRKDGTGSLVPRALRPRSLDSCRGICGEPSATNRSVTDFSRKKTRWYYETGGVCSGGNKGISGCTVTRAQLNLLA